LRLQQCWQLRVQQCATAVRQRTWHSRPSGCLLLLQLLRLLLVLL
jgi:hypothetical protein